MALNDILIPKKDENSLFCSHIESKIRKNCNFLHILFSLKSFWWHILDFTEDFWFLIPASILNGQRMGTIFHKKSKNVLKMGKMLENLAKTWGKWSKLCMVYYRKLRYECDFTLKGQKFSKNGKIFENLVKIEVKCAKIGTFSRKECLKA